MASDIISQVGKGKRQSVTQALADTGMFRAPTIAGDDDSGLFNMSAIKEWDARNRTQTIIPGESTASQVAADPLAAIKAKDAQITNTPTVPTIAGLTPNMVQRPMQTPAAQPSAAASAVPAIAGRPLPTGVKQFAFNNKQPAGGVVANGAGNDFSPGSPMAIAGNSVDSRGRTYDEQVAFAKQFNSPAAQIQRLAAQIPYQAGNQFDGAQKIAGINTQIAGLQQQAKLETEQYKSDTGLAGQKHAADQALAGHKIAADSNVKAHELTAIGNVEKAKIAGAEKAKEQGQKDYTDRIKGLVGDWSKLNLPKEYVPKLNEFAKIHAAAEDPQSNTFMMPPNREGGMYAAMPKQYESVYSKLLQTMPHKDAAARVYEVAKKQGHVIDVPDFKRFLPTAEAIKSQNQSAIAGV